MTKSVELSEAQDRLADLMAQAATGTEIVSTEGRTPRARLIPLPRRVPELRRRRLLVELLNQLDAEHGPVDESLVEKYLGLLG